MWHDSFTYVHMCDMTQSFLPLTMCWLFPVIGCVHVSGALYDVTHCTTLQHTAPHCNALQHTATHSDCVHVSAHFLSVLGGGCRIGIQDTLNLPNGWDLHSVRDTTTRCKTLQHCNTLHHPITLQHIARYHLHTYGVATMSRLLKTIGLFCKRAL